MALTQGINVFQVPSRLIPTARIDTAIPVVIGTAPIHRLENFQNAMPGSVIMCNSFSQAENALGIGINDNFEKWGLSKVAFSQFVLSGASPVIFINIYNPNMHRETITNEAVSFIGMTAMLANTDIISGFTLSGGGTTFVEGKDYHLNRNLGRLQVIVGSDLFTAITGTTASAITANYICANTSIITSADVLDRVDLFEQAFQRFDRIPAFLHAANFDDPNITNVLAAKTEKNAEAAGLQG